MAASATSAASVLALLEEEEDSLKVHALQQLNQQVDQFWFQISGSVGEIEALYEDEEFSHRELAALVASKVFYHLGDLDDALTYALGAGALFDVNDKAEYVLTILARCIDRYIALRSGGNGGEVDPRLESIVERLFQRCSSDGQYEQAVGIALEARRLDQLEAAITSSPDRVQASAMTLTYALDVTQRLIVSREFRNEVRVMCCLTYLDDASEVAKILHTLLSSGSEDSALLAYQIGFNLAECEVQGFLNQVETRLEELAPTSLPPAAPAPAADGGGAEAGAEAGDRMETEEAGAGAGAGAAPAPAAPAQGSPEAAYLARRAALARVLSGAVPIELERQFLARHSHADLQILKNIKEALRAAQHEVVQHGACLGLGLAGLGTADEELFEDIKNVLYMDNAVAGEAAGLALGLLLAGSGSEHAAEMLAYAHDTQHEKIIRGLAVGLALVQYGREEAAEALIEQMSRDQDPTLRYGAMYVIGMAYRGTANNGAIQKLLHFAVTDVSNDVRRAAVLNLGFVLLASPEQCPKTVRLLAESYNPHVRYGAAMAVGIACAGTGLREVVALLEPMLGDSTDFVQQGALLAMALVLVEQPEARQKVGPDGGSVTSPGSVLREKIDKLYGNKGAELLTRMGSIMAAGVLDAGGRNATVGLRACSGLFRRTAVVGLALFTQHWYWYPLAYTLSLSLQPTALIGVDATLQAGAALQCPALSFLSSSLPAFHRAPSLRCFVPPGRVEDKKDHGKLPTAVLSTTARAKARAKAKKKEEEAKKEGGAGGAEAMETDKAPPTDKAAGAAEGAGAEGGADGAAAEDGAAAAAEGEEKQVEGKTKEEPGSFEAENPARVVPAQRRFIRFLAGQRFQPIRPATAGFVPEEGEVEYLFVEKPAPAAPAAPAAEGGAAPPAPAVQQEEEEPPPPEPFDYVPS
eukprot:scaffold15.g4301.t1